MSNNPQAPRALRLLPIIFILILSGCSMYEDVTGYFNTYYNSQKLFNATVEELNKAIKKDKDSLYFIPYKVSAGVEKKLDSVIAKCSKIIQFYPESKWIDDAIVMIGKSYVYLNENDNARKKFEEIVTNFPESDLRFEAKLWSAKAEYFDRNEEVALKIAREVTAEAVEEGEDDIAVEAMMLESQIYFERAEYAVAADAYEKTAGIDGSGLLRATAQYWAGKCLEALGEFDNAIEAYRKVDDYTPDPALAFRARLHLAMMEIEAGKYDEALETLDQLREEALLKEEKGLVELEIGNTYNALGDTAKAFAFYTAIDSNYKKTDAGAKAYYRRGLLYEYSYNDFKTAKLYYEKARNEFAASAVTPVAKKKVLNFTRYFKVRTELAKNDSLLDLALHPEKLLALKDTANVDSTKRDSTGAALGALTSDSVHVDTAGHAIAAETPAPAGEAPASDDVIELASADSSLAALENAPPPAMIPDESPTLPDQPTDEGQDPPPALDEGIADEPSAGDAEEQAVITAPDIVVDEANDEEKDIDSRAALPELHRERRITRDMNAERTDMLDEDESDLPPNKRPKVEGGTDSSSTSAAKADSAAQKKAKPAPKITPDSLRVLISQWRYELATLMLLELEMSDSAKYWFEKVLEETPTSPYVPRALYALAEIYRADANTPVVDSLYDILLLNHADSKYAGQIRKVRGIDTAAVQLEPAQEQYRAAELLLQEGNTEEALKAFEAITLEFPADTIAAKALYTMGWIYENVLLDNDSAAAKYKVVMKDFPKSSYASAATPKVSVKEDTTTLSKFIKIKEIAAIPKPAAPQRVKTTTAPKDGEEGAEDDGQAPLRGRNAQRDLDDEEDDGTGTPAQRPGMPPPNIDDDEEEVDPPEDEEEGDDDELEQP